MQARLRKAPEGPTDKAAARSESATGGEARPRPGSGRGGRGNGGSLRLPSLLCSPLGTPISSSHCSNSKP
uniref:Uncharacterized protein n=1 Tax=Setaria italica TaxID=4555 RepID=K3ZFR3_SETIT